MLTDRKVQRIVQQARRKVNGPGYPAPDSDGNYRYKADNSDGSKISGQSNEQAARDAVSGALARRQGLLQR